jgi:hypothetical protein
MDADFFLEGHYADFMGASTEGERINIDDRDFYFRAPASLVVLSFPQLVSFSSVFPSL